ncbi:MAG: hypothetical protein SFV15_05240 [Polyangiaceae bacterium]|nr:hypothetical protein [Polyangiaceae bacterium]
MASDRPDYPSPQPGDPEDVRVALQAGEHAWKSGNEREALRSLQRATLAATKTNPGQRAGQLAQAVAALSQRVGGQVLTVPTLSKPVPTGATPENDYSDTTVVDGPAETVSAPKLQAKITPPKARMALRVAVEPTPGEPNVLRVHLLEDGRAPAQGLHEAFLVAVEPLADLLRRKDA